MAKAIPMNPTAASIIPPKTTPMDGTNNAPMIKITAIPGHNSGIRPPFILD